MTDRFAPQRCDIIRVVALLQCFQKRAVAAPAHAAPAAFITSGVFFVGKFFVVCGVIVDHREVVFIKTGIHHECFTFLWFHVPAAKVRDHEPGIVRVPHFAALLIFQAAAHDARHEDDGDNFPLNLQAVAQALAALKAGDGTEQSRPIDFDNLDVFCCHNDLCYFLGSKQRTARGDF